MGWLIILALMAIAGGALWKWGRLPRVAFEPVAAALLLGRLRRERRYQDRIAYA
jgi:hypothetical protein